MIPTEFTAGDTVKFTETIAPAAQLQFGFPIASYSCIFVLRGAGTVTIPGIANGDGTYNFIITAALSETLTPGRYSFRTYLEGNGERFPIREGFIVVRPNLTSQQAGYDNRSKTEIYLDQVNAAIDALMQGGAIQNLEIMGRSLRRYDLEQLLQLKKTLEAQLAAERRASGQRNPYRYIAAGRPESWHR